MAEKVGRTERRRSGAFDPLRPAGPVLTFPNGNPRLEFIDHIAGRFERVPPVTSRHSHSHRGFANRHLAYPVLDNNGENGPFVGCFQTDLPKLRFDMFGVRLVLEVGDPCLLARMVSRRTEKESGCARVRSADFGYESSGV